MCHFMAAVLTQTRAITEQGVQTLQSDHDQLVQFFQQNCKPERVVKLSAPLQDLKDVAAADSVDTFVLTYTTLLQVHVFLPVLTVTRLCFVIPYVTYQGLICSAASGANCHGCPDSGCRVYGAAVLFAV